MPKRFEYIAESESNFPKMKKNILITVDVEDWFQVENFKPWIPYGSWDAKELRVEDNIHRLLDLFDAISGQIVSEPVKATFFVLGWIARKRPNLVRLIQQRGHEIASHGLDHHLCTDLSFDLLKKDMMESKKLLEDITGEPVVGYRAPSFAVTASILDMVGESGYLYDSSYNSFDRHDRYGHLDLSEARQNGIAYELSDMFFELPVSNLKLADQIIPWGGGGYFRLIPYPVFMKGVKAILARDDAYLFYMHPWEIDPGQPRVKQASVMARFRHYNNLRGAYSKLSRMMSGLQPHRFFTCHEYIKSIKMNKG